MIEIIIQAIWFMLPAYVANPMAVVARGKRPMDFKRKFVDGKRVFGNGKTWEGFFTGSFSGIVLGLILNTIAYLMPNSLFPTFGNSFEYSILVISLLSFGSMIGDLLGSFFKRRIGYERGSELLGLDQLSFVAGSWLLLYLGATRFFIDHYYNVIAILTILIFTPFIHRTVNIIGYRMKLKQVPW